MLVLRGDLNASVTVMLVIPTDVKRLTLDIAEVHMRTMIGTDNVVNVHILEGELQIQRGRILLYRGCRDIPNTQLQMLRVLGTFIPRTSRESSKRASTNQLSSELSRLSSLRGEAGGVFGGRARGAGREPHLLIKLILTSVVCGEPYSVSC